MSQAKLRNAIVKLQFCRLKKPKRQQYLTFATVLMCLLTCLLVFFCKEPHSIARQLACMPQEDRHSVEFFFRSAIAFDGFGYGLFGDKPLSVLVYCESPSASREEFFSCHPRFHSFNNKIKQGWICWSKHQGKFHLKNYALIKSKNFVHNNFTAIVLVNKKSVLETIDAHLEDFKSILGAHVSSKGLLEEILQSNDIFYGVLQDHQGLIGTLLGYGRNNAWTFHQRYEMQMSMEKNFIHLLRKTPIPEERDALNKKLQPFTRQQRFNRLFMSLPTFVADLNSLETQLLYKKYEHYYQNILQRYKEGDFLEITLQQLSSS